MRRAARSGRWTRSSIRPAARPNRLDPSAVATASSVKTRVYFGMSVWSELTSGTPRRRWNRSAVRAKAKNASVVWRRS